METIGPYRADVFNDILGLGDSNKAFQSQNGPAVIDSPMRDLLFQHQVTHIFGVCLVHRHFPLKNNEILVEVNGTSTAWEVSELQPSLPGKPIQCYKKPGGLVKPHCWTVDSNGLFRPYEFFFEPFGANATPDHGTDHDLQEIVAKKKDFFLQFCDLLDRHRLRGIVGLRLLHRNEINKAMVEVSEKLANITFPLPPGFDLAQLSSVNGLEATWAYTCQNEASADRGDRPGTQVPTSFCITACLLKTHVKIHYSSS
ncbi:hypothetical protein MKZ38_005728 [Zalerion maritima]|uniref:Uncharacterized protein n=1 Tax=Zalerion maritima TaxID=339359 RepID=A0AAD5RJT8_9PEZI|nr:hypothetical protein MKZ38_005728 [Zalerion maritima]